MKRIKLLLAVLLAIVGASSVGAQDPYAVLTNNGTTLTFYYDTSKASRTISLGESNVFDIPWSGIPDWTKSDPEWTTNHQNNTITTVTFDPSFAGYRLKSTAHMFSNYNHLETINNLNNLNTSEVTNMEGMFKNSYLASLASLDLRNFNTVNVTNMSCMFEDCFLTSLDLTNFNTMNVTNMEYMFAYTPLTSLDLTSFNTENVTNMEGMFTESRYLKTIYCNDNWQREDLNSSAMFWMCYELKGAISYTFGLDDAVDANYANPTNGFFTQKRIPYAVLTYGEILPEKLTFYYDTEKHTRSGSKFNIPWLGSRPEWTKFNINEICDLPVVFDASFADYHGLTNASHMFDGYYDPDPDPNSDGDITQTNYIIQNLHYLNTENVTNMSYMFAHNEKIEQLDLSNFNVENVTNMNGMFAWCSQLETLDLSNFDVTRNHIMNDMFNGCSSLQTIYCNDNWQKTGVASENMFKNCTSLKGGNETVYSADHVDATYAHPDVSNNPGYFTRTTNEPYAVISADGTTLTFYYDKNKTMYPNENVFAIPWNGDYPGWTSYEGNDNITTIVFNGSFANYDGLESTKNMFYDLEKLKTITNLQYLKTENVTDMSNMFYGLQEIETINNLQYLNTENVTNMSSMFDHCYKLKTLDLNNFKTSNVTDMNRMFALCKALTSLNLGNNFDTSNVTDMKYMFFTCEKLASLDLGDNFNTSNVKSMNHMFSSCKNLFSLNLGDKFNTGEVMDMSSMFYLCERLASLNLSTFNTSNVTNMESMFSCCYALTTLDVANFNTSEVTNMKSMFYYNYNLKTIYCNDNWQKTGLVSENMFSHCTNLKGGNETVYSADHVDAEYANPNNGYFTSRYAYAVLSDNGTILTFYYDTKKDIQEDSEIYEMIWESYPDWGNPSESEENTTITTVTFDESFKTCRLERTTNMFRGLAKLETINHLDYLNTENVRDMSGMFYGCSSLTSIDLRSFKTSKVTSFYDMFAKCSKLTELDLSNFDVSHLEDISYMFYDCTNLKTIFCAEDADWSQMEFAEIPFYNCTSLSGKYGSMVFSYDVNKTDKTYAKVCKNGQNGYFTYIGNLDGQSVTLNANGYATYASSLPVDFTNAEGYTAWQITGIISETITFEQITGSVAAGTGVLLMGEAGANITINFSTYGDAHSDNMLVGFTTATDIADDEYYGLSGNQFVKVNAGIVPAGKALLPADEVQNVKSLNLVFNDETGIIETRTVNDEQTTSIFNLAGQRLAKPQRGINIVNGKKVLVK